MPFLIDNSNSGVTNTGLEFFGGGIGTMTADAFVFYTGPVFGVAVQLNDPSWNVTINGVIQYLAGQEWALGFGGSTGSSRLTIGETGVIESGNTGVFASHTLAVTLSHASSVVLGEHRAFDLRGNNSSVTNKGFIGTTLAGSPAIEFSGEGKHTVTNSGQILSGPFPYGTAIRSTGFNAADTINNSATGSINGVTSLGSGNDKVTNAGNMAAVDLGEGTNRVANTGLIFGAITGGSGNDVVTNGKSIVGALSLGDGINSVTGAGTIQGAVTFGAQNDTLSVTGKVTGAVDMGGGNNTVKLSELVGNLTGETGNDIVTVSKSIAGDVNLGDGNNSLKGAGAITGNITLGNGNNVVGLTGLITGNVTLGTAVTQNVVSIASMTGDFTGGSGNDIVTVNGTHQGVFVLGDGNDRLALGSKAQIETSIVDMGGGNDTFLGGGLIDKVGDGNGADNYQLGAGNDIFVATGASSGNDGTDTVNGGTGVDDYNASLSGKDLKINLGAEFTDTLIGTLTGFRAQGDDVGIDNITGFEDVNAGSGDDQIAGTAGINFLFGADGSDRLFGLAGNDFISGGAGKDQIVGGVGADWLYGGEISGPDGEFDMFHYRSITESTVSSAGRDIIWDFEVDHDIVDVSAIDANSLLANDQKFKLLGQDQTFTDPGDMRFIWTQITIPSVQGTIDATILSADINGDAKADFSIVFQGHLNLTTAMFNL